MKRIQRLMLMCAAAVLLGLDGWAAAQTMDEGSPGASEAQPASEPDPTPSADLLPGPLPKKVARLISDVAEALEGKDAASESETSSEMEVEAPDEEKEPFREQRVYITYEQLRKVFEREGRGVYLPYDQFLALWEKAQASEQQPPPREAPVDFLIREINNRVLVEGDVVRVHAILKIELFREGWISIPLRLADAAVTEAEVEGSPARIVSDPGTGNTLLAFHDSPDPSEIELHLQYAKAYQKSPGRNQVSFMAPQGPVNRWDVRIPEEGVKVDIQPMVAASEVIPPADAQPLDAKETRMLAFVGPAPTVGIQWTAKAEGAKGLEALARVQAEQKVRIDEGVIRTNVSLNYTISRAELPELKIELPPDQKVVNVFDPNVRQWRVEAEADRQVVTIELFEPARGGQQVILELERYWEENLSAASVQVPVIRAESVRRQTGTIVVDAAEGLRVEAAAKSGLMQVDVKELSEGLGGAWDFAFRYSALPFSLELAVEKIAPRVTVNTLAEAFLDAQELRLVFQNIFQIERAGVFRLELALPEGFQVRKVQGFSGNGVSPVQVDSFHVTGSNQLIVNLANRAQGTVGLDVQLAKDLAEPDLLNPTGRDALLDLGLVRPTDDVVERHGGRLIVYAPENLRLNPSAAEGLRAIPVQQARAEVQGASPASGARPVLAYSYTEDPVTLTLAAQRRRPHVTVRQMLVARVDSGVVKYQTDLFLKVQYSGVKSIRLDLPAEVAGLARITTPGIRHSEEDATGLEPPVADGMIAWSVAGESEFLGDSAIRLEWEKQLDGLVLGKSIQIDIPRLIPQSVDRAWGQVVLAKAETIDVQAGDGLSGLQPIDPVHDLMEGVSLPDAAWAFEFHQEWALPLIVTKYELLEDIKRTSVERGLVSIVLTRGREQAVQALFRVRSVQQRLLLDLPEDVVFDTDPLRINGRSVPLERGDEGQYFIPLVGQDPERPFLLELRYTLPDRGSRFVLPEFPERPAIQEVYLAAYIPQERIYLGKRGAWTPRFELIYRGLSGIRIAPHRSRGDLLSWVSTDTQVSGAPEQNFPVDGQFMLYSSLNPVPGREGSLAVSAMNRRLFNALVIILTLAIGISLIRVASLIRWALLGLYFSVLAAGGLFLPTFTLQLMGQATFIVVLVVIILWLLFRGCVRGLQDFRASLDRLRRKVKSENSSSAEKPGQEEPGQVQTPGKEKGPAAGEKNAGGPVLDGEDIGWDEEDDRHV